MDEKARFRVAKARIAVQQRDEFLSNLIHRLIPKETQDVPTTATDGIFFFYNPECVTTLSEEELAAAVEHETFHPALDHIRRLIAGARDAADADLRNKACDYSINPLQKFRLPAWALHPAKDGFEVGKSAEWYYDVLKHQQQNQNQQQQQSSGRGCGGMLTPKDPDTGRDMTPDQQREVAESWQVAVTQAANTAAKQGKLSDEIARLVDQLKRPAVNWRAILDRFMRDRVKTDYTLIPPNRRYAYRGLFLHSISDELRIRTIVDVFDTSGSVYAYAEVLQQFVSEQRAIVRDVRPESLLVLDCDDELKSVREFTADSFPESLELHGGGGTDFRPPFEYLEREGIEPECLIYFTDLYGTFPAIAPRYPVLWIVYGRNEQQAPFGETVHIR